MESHVECVQVILDERDKPKTKLQEGGAMDLAQQIDQLLRIVDPCVTHAVDE